MDSINYVDKCGVIVDNLKENTSQKVIEVMKTRPIFFKNYLQQLNDKSKDFGSLLKEIIKNENEWKELKNVLLHTGNDEIAIQIDENLTDLCDLNQCDPCDPNLEYKEKFSFGDRNHKYKLDDEKNSLSFSLGGYPMCETPRGLCVLINNYFTIGTYKEMQIFRNIFYQLHFDAVMRKNLLNSEIEALLEDFIPKNHDLSKHNAFVFMIITPGNRKEQIIDSENQSLDILKLIKILNGPKYSTLEKKPKLLFFNCIRDDSNPTESTSAQETDSSPIINDWLEFPLSNYWFICHSTLENSIDWEKGTVFGHEFAEKLKEFASHKDIHYIIQKTRHEMKKKFKENFSRKNTLTGDLFFIPNVPWTRKFFSMKTLKTFISNMKENKEHRKLIELIHQLCKRLQLMHDNNGVHNNIKPENINISIPDDCDDVMHVTVEDFQSTKIKSNVNSNSGEGGYLCWRAPEIIEELNYCRDFVGTKESDIFSLGCVIYFVISRGSHPFEENFASIVNYSPELKALNDDQYMIYKDLIEAMISCEKIKRPSIARVLNHPMFWTSNTIKEFFVKIRDQLQNTAHVKHVIPKHIIDKIKTELKTNESTVFGTDWFPKLSPELQLFENDRQNDKHKDYGYRIKNSKSIESLIKYVRDKACHPSGWPLNIDPVDYLTEKFPLLLIYTYNAFEKFSKNTGPVLNQFYC